MNFDSPFLNKALGADVPESLSAHRVWTDSRSVQAGDLFVAVSGENFDGHEFVKDAASKGAVAAIVEKPLSDTTIPLIEVPDSVQALRQIAGEYRKNLKAKVIAVAGSNGKTTTKELIAFLLKHVSTRPKVYRTKKSQNSILGIAMSLLEIKNEDWAVIEIGIDEPGWMQKHLELVDPDYGIVTNIAEEHLAGFKSLDAVEEEECRLLDYLKNKGQTFALNVDDERLRNRKADLTYGLRASTDFEGLYSPPNRLQAFSLEWKLSQPGEFNALNLLAALSVLITVYPNLSKKDFEALAPELSRFEGEAHRSLWKTTTSGVSVFDDCYNANPKSMLGAIRTFAELSDGRRSALVLGDMLELGPDSTNYHLQVLNRIDVLNFDHLYLYGEEFAKAVSLWKSPKTKFLSFEKDFEALKDQVHEDLKHKDFATIMLKGSRGMRLERLLPLFET